MWELIGALLALAAPAGVQSQDPTPPPEVTPEDRVRYAEADTDPSFARIAFNFYTQSDGGGNPHLEEDMTVLEPQVLAAMPVSERWIGTLKLQADIISAASVESGKRFPRGTQSGASGDKYLGVDGGAFYAWSDRTSIGGTLSYSSEYDYRSTGATLKWTHDTPSRNDTFSIRVSGYHDMLKIIRFDGSDDEGTDTRNSYSIGLGWTHVLTGRTVGTVNWDVTFQEGFLSTPYNSVVAAGTEVTEVLPDSRVRNALHTRVRHLLWDDLAVEPGLGFYVDDWGAVAGNFEIRLFWEVLPEVVILRPGYRFHVQSEVDDWLEDTAAAIPEFRTQDSDLADFTSHTVELAVILPRVHVFGADQEIELAGGYTTRSDDLNAAMFTVGYQWRF